MPGDFTYLRKYIIFKNDYTNIDNINPKGHGKIEIKGNKGTVRVNLENCEIDQEYRIYLLKEEKGVVEELDLGRILTDEKGRCRTDINISPRELELKGFPVEKLDAIVIRREENILLGAYIDKGTGTIDKYIGTITRLEGKVPMKEDIQLETEPEQTEPYQEPYAKEIQPIEDPEVYMEEIDQANESMKEDIKLQETEEQELSEYFPVDEEYGYFGEEEETEIEEEPQEVKVNEIEEDPVQILEENSLEKEPIEETEQDKSEEVVESTFQEFYEEQINQPEVESEIKINEEPVEPRPQQFYQGQYSHQYGNYQSLEYMRQVNNKNQMTNYILSVLKFFPQVQPLKIYLHGYTWWRIDDNGSNSYRGFLPYYNYLFSADYKYPFLHNSTTCINQIMRYGHYLFGLYREANETKYYVYAIPGRFTVKEHPFKGITGFNTWYESIDGIGYWILYIDPMTGKVIYPINPMVPTE